jgi:hypothetical protein
MRRLSRWSFFAALVAIAAVLAVDAAQSQRRPQRGDQTQGQPQQPQQPQQTPAPKSEAEIAEEARRRQERAEFDRKFATLNDQLAQYSFILTIVAGLQFIALAALMIVLGMIFRGTRIGAAAAKESADTLRKSLVVLDRPYVLPTDVGKIYFSDDHPHVRHFVHFKVANFGKTPAILHHVRGKFVNAELPLSGEKVDAANTPDGTDEIQDWGKTMTLGPGQRLGIAPFFLPRHIEIEKHERFGRPPTASRHELFLQVTISFWDMERLERTHRSVWKYDQARHGFVSWGDRQLTCETEHKGEGVAVNEPTPRFHGGAAIHSALAKAMESARWIIQRFRSMSERGIRAVQAVLGRWSRWRPGKPAADASKEARQTNEPSEPPQSSSGQSTARTGPDAETAARA